MPVRRLPLHILNPMGEFYRDCFYHSLDSDLKAGRSMSTVIDEKIVSVVKTRRMVAYALGQFEHIRLNLLVGVQRAARNDQQNLAALSILVAFTPAREGRAVVFRRWRRLMKVRRRGER
jgi:hypothetical protein